VRLSGRLQGVSNLVFREQQKAVGPWEGNLAPTFHTCLEQACPVLVAGETGVKREGDRLHTGCPSEELSTRKSGVGRHLG